MKKKGWWCRLIAGDVIAGAIMKSARARASVESSLKLAPPVHALGKPKGKVQRAGGQPSEQSISIGANENISDKIKIVAGEKKANPATT